MIKLTLPFLAFALLLSCKNKSEKISPKEEKITESVYASGIIKSKDQYQAFSTVSGIIKEILVTEGDTVKQGDIIMRLSNDNARLNSENAKIAVDYSSPAANADKLNQLKIDIETAKAKMDNDASLLEKQRNLWNQGIGNHNELDQRELAYKNSSNAYAAAKLRLGDLQQQLNFQSRQSQKKLEISNTATGDYNIKSEVSGKVYSVLKKKGEMVNPQSPVALIGNAAGFTLELQVDEYDITKIRLGQKIIISMDSYKGQVFEALVEKIDPLMNPQSKSFTVEAGFIKPPPALYPNLTLEANIIIQVKEKALTIPREYLVDDNYVLLENKEKRKVTTGLKDYQKIEILDGLSANDFIIKPN
jgi:multidrug efflux pump subunit AcrA (membrane-fusion protein)